MSSGINQIIIMLATAILLINDNIDVVALN